ncbi:MAG: hypothetical protein LBQ64_05265 [Bacteroidales bacterium]|jgi:cell division protein FtsQ|nr:hypothetical protein [Bacteroidales bacterium]
MNRKRKISYILFPCIFIGCFVVYAYLTKGQRFEQIEYSIEYPSDTLFVKEDFSQYINSHCPVVIGKLFDSVNLSTFEKKVEEYPYISNADVIHNKKTLIVKAKQEKIIAKITNRRGEEFLLAQSGKLVPKRKNSGRIIVANGNIPNRYVVGYFVGREETSDKSKGKKNYSPLYTVWKIACFIENDPFWKAQTGQIYVNEKQEIELVPTVGDHIILFGKIALHEDADKTVQQRFDNLKYLYTEGFKITGWERYKLINLKYGTEIPCEKKK